MTLKQTKVLYLAGVARSGSTLLGRLMGEPTEAVHVGEMVYIWQRSLQEDTVCGCGRPFRECPFWSEVFERGFGGFDRVDVEAILSTKRRLEKTRVLPRLLSPWKSAADRRRLEKYQQVLATLYRAIAEVSGAELVVDGSKSESYGYILDGVPELDVRGVHLVRDSRAVAYSQQRRKPDPSRGEQADATLPTTSPARTALVWNTTNLLLMARTPGHRSLRMRYEDCAINPEAALRRLWKLAEEPIPALDFLSLETPFFLRTNHTVAGNPDRFHAEIKIRPDLAWHGEMRPAQRRLLTALTWPLLLRFGYIGHRKPQNPRRRA